MLTTHNIDIQAMLVLLTLPFYDFCGFRSVAVNSVYKLQFFTFISNIGVNSERIRRTRLPIFYVGIYQLGNPPQHLTFVLMVKIDRRNLEEASKEYNHPRRHSRP